MKYSFVSIITLVFSIRNSKGNILARIDCKEEQIRKIDYGFISRYGMNRGHRGYITPLDEKKSKLLAEIRDLKRKL